MIPRILVLGSALGALLSGQDVSLAVSLAGERDVAISPETDAREVNRSFSPQAHGPTQKFFLLPEARAPRR